MSDSFLLYVPVSQQALIEKSYSHYKLGQNDSAAFYSWKFKRIMNAMAQSGDGLTPETATFSLGPTDGQNFIRKYLKSKTGTMGSGRDKNGNFVDILEIVMKDKETGIETRQNLYFQIEHAVKKMFSEDDLNKMENSIKNAQKEK